MNFTITIAMDKPPKKKTPESLETRVDYAIECIYCDVNKKRAIEFLQKAQVHLDSKDHQTKEDQVLLEKITVITSKYGFLPLPNKDNK